MAQFKSDIRIISFLLASLLQQALILTDAMNNKQQAMKLCGFQRTLRSSTGPKDSGTASSNNKHFVFRTGGSISRWQCFPRWYSLYTGR
ncbi:hypothetical protein C8F04DRAFT_1080710 [Mycena alexandri]|uniref:Secreted protein n=1 Tax=Mycena alexandri TaxID=1745969 RepID=A0AAD6T8B3_9AGAR|nr:hypothetical protein C8F04DRAFT_1080710 [Mycena alexandri]